MTAHLALIRRHPIKSVGGEGLERVRLAPARRMPGDREWAVLNEAGERHAGTGAPDHWLPKSCFLRGAAAPGLQAVKGGWQDDRLHLRHPDRPDLIADPETEGAAVVDWLRPLWPADKPTPTRLVRGAGIWTDVKWPWVSILSLDSLAALEADAGRAFGTDRWRGNLWVQGWAPWAERDLIGQVIQIGAIELRVTDNIGRCSATNADTTTGREDGDTPALLDRLYGHSDFGIYAEVVTGGTITLGNKVTV